MPSDMGPLKKGMRVALASGTARVTAFRERSQPQFDDLSRIHNLMWLLKPLATTFPSQPVI